MQGTILGGNVRRVMGAAPLILVCNDDGIHSEGIAALAEALRPLGEVVIAAPDRERSADGSIPSVSHTLLNEKGHS